MRLYCCYTPAHEVLYREIFLPSIPSGFELHAYPIGIEGPGDYLSNEFLKCIRAKLALIVQSLSEPGDEVIVWSDVDIQFFDLDSTALLRELDHSGCDVLFQRESFRLADVNTGFFVCRRSPTILSFFRHVSEELAARSEENEQMTVNRILHGISSNQPGQNLRWDYLPRIYYARTHGWPPPLKIALYHANYTKGPNAIRQKLLQFSEINSIKQWGVLAWTWSIIHRISRRI